MARTFILSTCYSIAHELIASFCLEIEQAPRIIILIGYPVL